MTPAREIRYPAGKLEEKRCQQFDWYAPFFTLEEGMQYQVEDISPVKKKIDIKVGPEEVNAALMTSIALYKRGAEVKGFRKGKVPSSIIESRYKKEIYSEATTELINAHINEILGELKLVPVTGIDVDAGQMVKNEEFNYSITFEVRPAIELPEVKGLKAKGTQIEVREEDIQEVIDRLRRNLATYTPMIADSRPPKDGELAIISFAAFKDGEPLKGIRAESFELPLGESQALPQFEDIVRELEPGQSSEKEVTFPEDFLNKELAGQTVTMKVSLHAIKEKILPEVDGEFAKKAGGFTSVEQLKEAIGNSYIENRKQVAKSATQKELIDAILAKTDFPLPESMVEGQVRVAFEDRKDRLERKGLSIESTGKTEGQIREELRPQAEDLVRSQLLLLAIADKENLEVSTQEVDQYLQQLAIRSGQDYNTIRDYHERNNLMFAIKDKLLADKAMDLIYDNAVIEEAEPVAKDSEEPAPSEDPK
jgi:trigger factor